ncbi:MAG: hypothetical protein GF331_26105 [Chitinivibrionales bacterium]|nr:hypothetical protein [Chitinivibrionales bacterium]
MRRALGIAVWIGFAATAALGAKLEPQTWVAVAGGGGVYVNTGLTVACKSRPVDGIVGFRVERRQSGGQWADVMTLSAPESYEQFVAGFDRGERVLPSPVITAQLPLRELWERVRRSGRLDSLGMYSAVLAFRLALGVTWCDTTARKGVRYEYRVSHVSASGNVTPVWLSVPVSYPAAVDLAPVKPTRSIADSTHVLITWTAGKGKRPADLKVYRRDDLAGPFSRVFPTLITSAAKDEPPTLRTDDTAVSAYHVYEYYVVPIDFYGNAGAPSDTVQAATYRFQGIPLPVDIRLESLDSLGGIRLHWRLPDTTNVRSIEVHRSDSWDSGYVKIAEVAAAETDLVDQQVAPMRSYFYYLRLTGLFGERSAPTPRVSGMYTSAQTVLAPTILRSRADSTGISLMIRSPDNDIVGYRIYRCAGPGMPLAPISDLVPRTDSLTVFTDSDSGLLGSRMYGYAARAENASHVLSALSDTVWTRPLTPTKPPAPVGLVVTLSGDRAVLHWDDLARVHSVAGGYQVYRRVVGAKGAAGALRPLGSPDSLLVTNECIDSTVEAGATYEYAVRSSDLFGGMSDLSQVVGVSVPAASLLAPRGLSARPSESGVRLSWEPTVQPGLHGFTIHRYQRGGKRRPIATLPAHAVEFVDSKVSAGELYFYTITATGADGRHSAASDEIGIRP